MPDLTDRLRQLGALRRSLRLSALLATIPLADGGERRVLGAAIVDVCQETLTSRPVPFRRSAAAREQSAAARALVQAWPWLPPDLRAVAGGLAVPLFSEAVTALGASAEARERRAAAAVARHTPDARAILIAGDLLFDTDGAVADEAEGAVASLCERISELTAEGASAVDAVVAMWGGRYPEHRRKGALVATLCACGRPGPRLRAFMGQSDQPAHMALRALVRKSPELIDRAACVRLLAFDAVGGGALERLGAPWEDVHDDSLRLGHLLLHPARRARLKKAAEPRRLVPGRGALRESPPEARRSAVRWIDALPDRWSGRADLVSALLTDEDAPVRHGAVRLFACSRRPDKPARAALVEAMADSDERIARSAAVALGERATRTAAEEMAALVDSPHAPVREIARRIVDAGDPWAAIDRDDGDVGPWANCFALRRALSLDRVGVVDGLRARIADVAQPGRRVRAMLAARRLGLAGDMELELLGAAASVDARVAATAVRAMAGAPASPSCRQAVGACLGHADGRVRASAVEAAARLDPGDGRIAPATRDGHARTRANAIRARLVEAKDPGAERALAEMLGDERAPHRLSALWVVERVGRTALAERVGQLAAAEVDELVRQRARRCGRRLLARMRDDWSAAGREPLIELSPAGGAAS